MVTVKGPGCSVATLESGGSTGIEAWSSVPASSPASPFAFAFASSQGIVIDGATTSATSFSRPSASTVGPASTSSTFSVAHACASPTGRSMGAATREYASPRSGRRSYANDVSRSAMGASILP